MARRQPKYFLTMSFPCTVAPTGALHFKTRDLTERDLSWVFFRSSSPSATFFVNNFSRCVIPKAHFFHKSRPLSLCTIKTCICLNNQLYSFHRHLSQRNSSGENENSLHYPCSFLGQALSSITGKEDSELCREPLWSLDTKLASSIVPPSLKDRYNKDGGEKAWKCTAQVLLNCYQNKYPVKQNGGIPDRKEHSRHQQEDVSYRVAHPLKWSIQTFYNHLKQQISNIVV